PGLLVRGAGGVFGEPRRAPLRGRQEHVLPGQGHRGARRVSGLRERAGGRLPDRPPLHGGRQARRALAAPARHREPRAFRGVVLQSPPALESDAPQASSQRLRCGGLRQSDSLVALRAARRRADLALGYEHRAPPGRAARGPPRALCERRAGPRPCRGNRRGAVVRSARSRQRHDDPRRVGARARLAARPLEGARHGHRRGDALVSQEASGAPARAGRGSQSVSDEPSSSVTPRPNGDRKGDAPAPRDGPGEAARATRGAHSVSDEHSSPVSGRPIVVAIDMGYGHLRPAHAIADRLAVPVYEVDRPPLARAEEAEQWAWIRNYYESVSRASSLPRAGGACGVPLYSAAVTLRL